MGTQEDVDPFQIEARLTSHGVYVTEFDRDEDTYRLEYESIAADKGAIPHREIGRVVNVFRDLHPDGWQGADIEATVTDLDGDVQGTWHVEADWFRKLEAGDLTEIEFSRRVIETIE